MPATISELLPSAGLPRYRTAAAGTAAGHSAAGLVLCEKYARRMNKQIEAILQQAVEEAGAALVVLGALFLSLVLGRDSNPDTTHSFRRALFLPSFTPSCLCDIAEKKRGQ